MSAVPVYLLLLLLSTVCPSPEAPRKVTPLCSWMGSDSQQAKPLLARCDSEDAWHAVWAKHLGQDITGAPWAPQVDFSKCTVIAIFTGAGTSRLGVMLHEVIEEKDLVRIRYWPMSQQVTASSSLGINGLEQQAPVRKDETHPYVMVLLPRTAKPIVLEEGHHQLLTDPFTWKEKARLERGKRE